MTSLRGILTNYQLPIFVIDEIIKYRNQLRKQTVLNMVEYAVMLDHANGKRVNGIIIGDKDNADIEAHLSLLNPNREYIQIHTHPRSSTFSLDDLILLLAYNEIKAMVVFGAKRRTYLLLKVEDTPRRGYINTLIQNEFRNLKPKYQKILSKKTKIISPKRVADLMLHEVLVKVTPSLGLKYFSLRE